MTKRIKVLGMGDSPLISTGYANQSRQIFEHLGAKPNKWEPHFHAWHYQGQPIKNATFMDGEVLNFTLYPGGVHPWGRDMIQKYINQLKPDIWWCTSDSFMLNQARPFGPIDPWITKVNFSPAKSVFWFPSDGTPFPKSCDIVLRKMDYPIAYSKFAQEQVKKEFNIDTGYIPLMTNVNKFFKMKNKALLRARWSKRIHDSNNKPVNLIGKKIVLCVARNQGRKMLDRMVKLIIQYPDKNTILLFKSHPQDPASAGVDLMNLARHYGVADRVCWVYSEWFGGFTSTEMREIYNLADVFALTTSGEGWGIPFCEAMATELPILATDFTTPREIVDGDERQLIKLATTLTGTFDVERGLADIDDFAKKLEFLMSDEQVRKDIGRSNRQKLIKEYDSKVVLKQWEDLFERIVHE